MGVQPILSIVVTVVSDTSRQADLRHLRGCLEALERQIDPPPMEVIVTCEAGLPGIAEVQGRFPHAHFLCLGDLRDPRRKRSREHHDVLRGIGFRRARASLIASLEDHARPHSRWSAQLVKEHAQPYAAIGGAIENGIDRLQNWAVYFCDFGKYQNPVPHGPAGFASDANVCYKREALDRVASAWADAYNEPRVHAALRAAGELIALSPDAIVYQHRLDLRPGSLLAERYVWGSSYAAVRVAEASFLRRILFAAFCLLLPFVFLLRQFWQVMRKRRNRGAFLRSMPLLFLLDIFWAAGESVGYLTGRPVGSLRVAQPALARKVSDRE